MGDTLRIIKIKSIYDILRIVICIVSRGLLG